VEQKWVGKRKLRQEVFDGVAMCRDEVVDVDEPRVVSEIRGPKIPGRMPSPMKQWVEQKREQQHRVVQRKDPECATNVEVAEPVRCFASVVENAGDEESGENKKNVDPDPSPAQLTWVIDIVLAEDEQDCYRTKAIERGVEAFVF
jgi:hypothetical protein